MRRTLALAFAVPFFGSLFACTAILGNFTVGTTASDAGLDVVVGPDSVAPDGDTDASGPAPMDCKVNGSPATLFTDTALQDRIWVHTLPGNQRHYRVVTTHGGQDVVVTTVDDKLNVVGTVVVNGFVASYDIRSVSSYDGGFIIFAIVNKAGTPRLDAIRFDDGSDVPSTAFTVITTLPIEVQQDSQFFVSPIDDVGSHDFYLAFSYKLGANAYQLDTHRVNLNPAAGPLPTEPTTTILNARPGGYSMVLAKAANQAFILMGGDQGQGALVVYQTDFLGKLLGGPTVVKPPNGGGFLPLVGMSATGPDDLNAVATIQGDLNNLSVPLGIRTGAFTGSQLVGNKGDINGVPPLVPLTVDQLAVDKGTPFWQFFPVQGPQMTSAARNTNTGLGVNLNWFDGSGHLRALRAGSTALFTNETVSGAAAALDGIPLPLASSLIVTWLNSTSQVRIARIGCLGK